MSALLTFLTVVRDQLLSGPLQILFELVLGLFKRLMNSAWTHEKQLSSRRVKQNQGKASAIEAKHR